MVDLMYRSPWLNLTPRGSGAGVIATAVERRAIATVMLHKGQLSALTERLRAAYGLELHDQPKRASGQGVSLFGIGPGKWLAMAEHPDFVATLTKQLDGVAAVVEQSDALAILTLSGPALLATFEKGFQIDLATFATDDCAVTSVDHLGVTVWKIDDATFEVAVARSLADAFLHWLGTSAAADGLAVRPSRG